MGIQPWEGKGYTFLILRSLSFAMIIYAIIFLAGKLHGQVINRPIPVCPWGFGFGFANNSLGTCDCEGQFFVSDSCHKGFYCRDPEGIDIQGVNYQGCEITCREDEILLVDPHNGGSWECMANMVNEESRPFLCPGKFDTECPCEGDSIADCPIGECECEDQLRVNHDCSKARFCKSNTDPSDFEEIDCSNDPDNHVVMVNLVYHTWYCGNDSGRCPGAFHVGCQDDPHDSSSTMSSMPPTSTDPGSGSTTLAVNWILPVLAFLIVFMKF